MKRLLISFTVAITILLFADVYADAPTNPSFEDLPDLDGWTVLDIGNYSGGGWVVRGGDATEGDAYGAIGLFAMYAYGETAWGPALKSSVFSAVAGETLSTDWRVSSDGGYCPPGDPSTGDDALGRGHLFDAGADPTVDLPVLTLFDVGPICGQLPWDISLFDVPYTGDFYLLFQVGSADVTGGGVIGAHMDVDNVYSVNLPPDCSGATATLDSLWPPNHKSHNFQIVGVTDPDGDEFTLNIDSILQDEPVNSADDGDTCPDAVITGPDSGSVLAERVGGELGFEGNGRVYHIWFTATDTYGATCNGEVLVTVPHDKKVPAYDNGPLYDSTVCP